MSGAVPLLPLYAFMACTKTLSLLFPYFSLSLLSFYLYFHSVVFVMVFKTSDRLLLLFPCLLTGRQFPLSLSPALSFSPLD
jgi:hypothetical protein